MLSLPTNGWWLQEMPDPLPHLRLLCFLDRLYAAGWSDRGLLLVAVITKVFFFQYGIPVRIFLKLPLDVAALTKLAPALTLSPPP